jgi:hypothetical protein
MPRTPFHTLRSLGAAAAFAVLVPAAAHADSPAPAPANPEPASPFAEAALSDGELGDTRGTAGMTLLGDVAVNMAEQTADIGNNTINAATTTGAITDNVVQDVRGVSMFNLNSGNFNNFQSIFQLNIQLGQ